MKNLKNKANKFLFLKSRQLKMKNLKVNPAFRKLFQNYIKKDRKREKPLKKNEGYGSI